LCTSCYIRENFNFNEYKVTNIEDTVNYWACRSEAIEEIKHNYVAILNALEEISDSTNLPDVRAKTKGLIYFLITFKFVFAMFMS
jgi:hypothetical protein